LLVDVAGVHLGRREEIDVDAAGGELAEGDVRTRHDAEGGRRHGGANTLTLTLSQGERGELVRDEILASLGAALVRAVGEVVGLGEVRFEDGAAGERIIAYARKLWYGTHNHHAQCAEGTSVMMTTVEGVYRKGRVELRERPANVAEESRVIVTFLEAAAVDLRTRGIAEAQAQELRGRLASFAEEWESAEMDAYDDYDAARAKR
jgi:hypothetical protein